METYEKYCNDDIFKVLNAINEMWSDYYSCCHGKYHALFVADTVEYILSSLFYDLRTVELGKIAGLLHDIGCIVGRRNHARMSAAFATVHLDVSLFLPDERNIVVQAIEDHSAGNNISSVIGAALLIADKIDTSKKRRLPIGPTHIFYDEVSVEPIIDDVEINISNNIITINYVTNDAFSINKDQHPYNLIFKAAQYLRCTCCLEINGNEVYKFI